MASNTTSERVEFTRAAQTALQRITQAQMALAFLGNDERAERVTVELTRVTELVGAMQTAHTALVNEHEALQDAFDGGSIRLHARDFVVEPIGDAPSAHCMSTQVGTLWVRVRGLVPLFVAVCVLVAIGTGAVRPLLTIPATTATKNGTSGSISDPAHLGDTLRVGMISCTLVSVALRPTETQSTSPGYGSATVTVHVQLRNFGSSYVSYSPSTFFLKLGAGEATNEESALSGNPGSSLGSGQLGPGASVEGDLVFAVRPGDHAAELTWKPLLRGDTKEHAWLLGT